LRERETELRKLVEQLKKEKEDNIHQMSQLQQGIFRINFEMNSQQI
jgi:hypothetical protein